MNMANPVYVALGNLSIAASGVGIEVKALLDRIAHFENLEKACREEHGLTSRYHEPECPICVALADMDIRSQIRREPHFHNFQTVMRPSEHQPGMFAEQACACGVELCSPAAKSGDA
jgi:hypothetical protein